jgi:hypothetical protein
MAEVVDDVVPGTGRSPSPRRSGGGGSREDDAKAALAAEKAADLADGTADGAPAPGDDEDAAKAALAAAKAADLADGTADGAPAPVDDEDAAKAALAAAKAADLADGTVDGTPASFDDEDAVKAALAAAKAADLADGTANGVSAAPVLNGLRSDDPRDTLDPFDFGARSVVDVTANVPEGMTVDTTPADLPAGSDRLGVGEDALLDGRLGSPLDDLPGPTTTSGPPDATLVGGQDMSLVGVITDTTADDPVPPPPPPPPPGSVDFEDTSDDWMDELEVERQTNPDAVDAAPPSDEEIERAITVRGGDTKPIDGDRPSIDGTEPPPRYGDLVTDPSPEAESTDVLEAPAFAPDAVVVHTINPDSGVVPIRSGIAPSGEDDVLGLTFMKVAGVEARPLADADATVEAGIIIPDIDRPFESLEVGRDLDVVELGDDASTLAPGLIDADLEFADGLDPGGAEPLEGSLPGDHDGDGFLDA